MSFNYDCGRYVIHSETQAWLEQEVARLKEERIEYRIIFIMAGPPGFALIVMRGFDSSIAIPCAALFALAIRCIRKIASTQDKLKNIRLEPVSYAQSKGVWGAYHLAVIGNAADSIQVDNETIRGLAAKCQNALDQLLALHTQCNRPIPTLANACVVAFSKTQKMLEDIGRCYLEWQAGKQTDLVWRLELGTAYRRLQEITKAIAHDVNQHKHGNAPH